MIRKLKMALFHSKEEPILVEREPPVELEEKLRHADEARKKHREVLEQAGSLRREVATGLWGTDLLMNRKGRESLEL
jgi:hypothetical protein